MLATSVRESPWSARCSGSSDGRATRTVPSSCAAVIAGCRVRSSSPLGPFTRTTLPSTVTVTPFGTGIGFFPIRDIARTPLPDDRNELASGARLARLLVRHQPLLRAQDRHAQPVTHAGNVVHPDVAPQSRRGD